MPLKPQDAGGRAPMTDRLASWLVTALAVLLWRTIPLWAWFDERLTRLESRSSRRRPV